MPAPATTNNLIEFVNKSGLHEKKRLEEYLSSVQDIDEMSPADLAARMVQDGMLTEFQAKHLLKGRYRNFFIGKFKVLEPLGAGGMSQVYLCEHAVMKHRVAMKLLPVRESEDKTAVSRFMREARAAAAVNHPNVVRAHDFDLAEKKFYYLIMDFVDGCNLHDLVKKLGPIPPETAVHYIFQAAHGLNHILECGLIHRDLKPSNLLLDRSGTIRILDLGLARFTGDDQDNLTRQLQGKSILGTADFLAPEQAIQSDKLDIRADIYSLGATFYFLLSGRAPFENQSVTQKLLAHQIREPDDLEGVPEEIMAICKKMMSKRAEDRYQSPNELIDDLSVWTTEPLPPPPEEWFQVRAGGIAAGVNAAGSGGGGTKQPPSTTAMSGQSTPVRVSNPAQRVAPPSSAIRRGPPSSKSGMGSNARNSMASMPEFDPMAEVDYPPQPRKTGMWFGIVIASLALIGAGMAIYIALTANRNNPGNSSVPGPDTNSSQKQSTPQGDLTPTPPGALVVGPNGDATIAEAITKAKPGDRILVTAAKIEESSVFNGKAKGVTIEAWPAGRIVPWFAPDSLSAGKPLVQISNVDGFRLKGFEFDGKLQADSIISVVGSCPGLILEALTIKGFRNSGAELLGASGASERPIRLDGVRFMGNTSQGIGFRVVPGSAGSTGSKSVSVTNCRFEGSSVKMGSGVQIAAACEDAEFRLNRFFKLNQGIHYSAKTGDAAPFAVNVANNCFFSVDAGFFFDSVPPAGSNLNLTNNLFMKTPNLAASVDIDGRPHCAIPDWVCHDADIKRKDGKPTGNTSIDPGTRYYRKQFEIKDVAKSPLVLDIGAVSAFKVWLNGELIGESRYPYFDKRIYAFPMVGKVKPGKNVIAVEVRHISDPLNTVYGITSGLMARIGTEDNDQSVAVKTDATWKSIDKQISGWEKTEFSDAMWTAVHVWPASTTSNWPWIGSVWDSAVKVKLAGVMPLSITSTGNFRDYDSNEGYPLLGTARGFVDNKSMNFPQDPDDDSSFLRSPRGHKLNKAGPEGTPVGVPAKD